MKHNYKTGTDFIWPHSHFSTYVSTTTAPSWKCICNQNKLNKQSETQLHNNSKYTYNTYLKK